MTGYDDEDLRRRFAECRDADAAGAPSFESVTRRPAPSRPRRAVRLVPVAVLLAAASVAAIVVLKASRPHPPSADEAIAQATSLSSWTAPTDQWLALSGLEIPSSVPSLTPSSVTLPETTTATTASGELR
jgi:hypothetical protein